MTGETSSGKRDWAHWIQVAAMLVLVIITGYYAHQTRSLVEVAKQEAEEIRMQRQFIWGINRPEVGIDLVNIKYPMSGPLIGLPKVSVQIPHALVASLTNKGRRSALGLETFVLGKHYDVSRIPPISGIPWTPQYSYWNQDVYKEGELEPEEEIQVTFKNRFELPFKEFEFPFIEEPDKGLASHVPFEFAIVAVYEDDFQRIWLSALELKYEKQDGGSFALKQGELRIFKVTPKD